MRVALLHDFFEKPGLSGGGEALCLTVAKAFHADVYTAYVHPDFKMPCGIGVKEIFPEALKMRRGQKTLTIMNAFERLALTGYEMYIFSGTNCITASQRLHPNLLYCHTPPRWLYDLREWFDKNTGFINRMGLAVLRKKVYPIDQHYMRCFDKIVANSLTVKERIAKYYDSKLAADVDVVYSFLDMKKYTNYVKKHKPQYNFYLSTARLDPLKRVDVIIEAFRQMPDKKLIVLSSGPMLDKIRKMSDGHDNIVVLGWVPEEKMLEALNECIATIQIPMNEDLGLGPMESMAMAKPCLAANEGGPSETVIDGKTGLLIEPTVSGIIKAVHEMTADKSKGMRSACLRRAEYFSKERFVERMKKAANDAMKRKKDKTH